MATGAAVTTAPNESSQVDAISKSASVLALVHSFVESRGRVFARSGTAVLRDLVGWASPTIGIGGTVCTMGSFNLRDHRGASDDGKEEEGRRQLDRDHSELLLLRVCLESVVEREVEV